MVKDLQSKQGNMIMLEQETEKLRTQLRERNDELSKIRELLKYKEEELNRRDEDILYREKILSEERRRFEEAKKEASGLDELEMKKRLEALRAEIHAKEEEMIAKEKFLNVKSEELRMREQGIIEDEIDARAEERALELQQAKVKTGNPRLNDLLLGGMPFGSNVLVHGPPFVGKEILVNQFMAEGLMKGIPILWVITDKTAADIREEMHSVISGYEEYEKLGFVRYIDSYSRSMGDMTEDHYCTYIDDPADHPSIAEAVDSIAAEFKEGHDYYRLAIRSISTLIAYSDPNSTFRFLNPFAGKRKKDRAVSMYVVEKGMHGEQEIQMLGMIMDGMIDFRVDQLRTFFSVRGICDVQSRGNIRYTFTNRGLTIGSFSLDHIK
jgi:KaiC/GvpD/RAD55 family RecA-like ATPase